MDKSTRENFLLITERINQCAVKANRSANTVNLVVVTKGQSANNINQVIDAGASDLGENYPEETDKKIRMIEKDVNWHMIGHLQSRKIKYLIDHFSMIHSIDNEEIASKIDKSLEAAKVEMPALIEVNLSGEGSKFGFPAWNEKGWPELISRLALLSELKNLHFCGFMTMPPLNPNPELSRPIFKKCRSLLELYQKKTGTNKFCHLSMGTSLDYEVAIQEGSTFLRIGQAIMGERHYK